MDHDFDFLVKPMAADEATSTNRTACPSEDDEGFKTPTSPRHRIPIPKQCPPAPGRPRVASPRRNIRKPSGHARWLVSGEVVELFPATTVRKNFQAKIKKDPLPVADMDAQFEFLVKPKAASNPTPVQEDETTTNGTASPCESNNVVRGVDDDSDEGFKTPTSPRHRIPIPKECPGAPGRPRVISPRRKIRKPITPRRRLLLDFSNEALFPPMTIRKIESPVKVVTTEEDVENKLS